MPPHQTTKEAQQLIDAGYAVQLLHARSDRLSAKSLAAYLDNVVIDCVPTPRQFGGDSGVIEPWQRKRQQWIIPAAEYIAGIRDEHNGPLSYYLGYAKGADKTSFTGRVLNWLLSYARRPLRIYCGAKDSEQAGIIRDIMVKEAALNPWLEKRLRFTRTSVEGVESKSRLEILTSDAGGIHGIAPDFIVCDEITHWQSRSLWDALIASTPKRSGRCMIMVLTNAGFLNTWQYDIRNTAREADGVDWHFFEQEQGTQLASWMSPKIIANVRKTMLPTEARRLYDNEWIDLAEEKGFLRIEDVDRCAVDVVPQPGPGSQVYIGVDYGGVIDRTALSVVWFDGFYVNVAELDVFQGSPKREIQIDDVELWLDRKLNEYPRATLIFDKHQLLGTIQKLEGEGRDVRRFEYRGGKANYTMAENLRVLISNHRLRFSKNAGSLNGETLCDELKQLIIKRMTYGYRFDHERKLHDDRTTAVGMAALEAVGSTLLNTVEQITTPKPVETVLAKAIPAPQPFQSRNLFKRRNLFGIRG